LQLSIFRPDSTNSVSEEFCWPSGSFSAVLPKFFTQTRVRTEVIFSLVLMNIRKILDFFFVGIGANL
jgi:hypothetical protein